MKKIIVVLIIISLVLSILIPVLSYTQSSYLSSAKTLESLGILKGYSNGNLGIHDYLKREDMVVLLSRLYDREYTARNFLGSHNFRDVRNSFYSPYIAWAVNNGLISGRSSNTFGFRDYVTVQEFQVVLLRVLGYGEEANLWNTVPRIADRLGIMRGLNINPKGNLTRGQLSVMVLNALKTTKKGSTLTLGYILGLNVN